jgi:hypothetical protein
MVGELKPLFLRCHLGRFIGALNFALSPTGRDAWQAQSDGQEADGARAGSVLNETNRVRKKGYLPT